MAKQKVCMCGSPSLKGLYGNQPPCQFHWDEMVWGTKWAKQARKERENVSKKLKLTRKHKEALTNISKGSQMMREPTLVRELREAGYIEAKGPVKLTQAGMEIVAKFMTAPKKDELEKGGDD